jgi:zinc protease
MSRFPCLPAILAVAGLMAVADARAASMAEHAERGRAAGIDVVTYRTAVRDVVDVVGYLPAGDALVGSGNPAVPTLLGMMLDRGTRTQDQFTIARELEEVGAEVSFNVGTQALQFQAKCLKQDLPLVLSIIAAELRSPALQPAEFAKVKQQLTGMLENQLRSTDARAQEALRRALYPVGHPNRPASIEEMIAATRSASLKELQAFHAKFYGPDHMAIVLVGDVSLEVAGSEIGKDFAGWRGGQDFLHGGPAPDATATPGTITVNLPQKTSVSALLGARTGLRYTDPDALALRLGTMIAGRGFTGRLMSEVRDRQGLTYDIGAAVTDDALVDGLWYADASFNPKLLDQGIAATRKTLQAWVEDGVTERELADAKQGLIGGYYVSLGTNQALARQIVTTLQRGLPLTWLDELPRAVQSLTREQVNAAIRSHVDVAKLTLVEAGTLPVVRTAPVPSP